MFRIAEKDSVQQGTVPSLQQMASSLIELSSERHSEPSQPMMELPRSSELQGDECDSPLLARLAREEHSLRSRRRKFLDFDVFGEPAWDMLLDLYASRFDGRRISVTSACIASNVPPTTALRWTNQLVQLGILRRIDDINDHRRTWLELTDFSYNAMSGYLAQCAERRFNRPNAPVTDDAL